MRPFRHTMVVIPGIRMNVQWPKTMEIAHICPMSMSELQKYAQDNRIQVLSFTRASGQAVESMGLTQGQNDSLYQLLVKSLEGKSSVAIVKLPGVNRGIVVVALPREYSAAGVDFPQLRAVYVDLHTSLLISVTDLSSIAGENKLVGLVFLTTPLPPRTPSAGQPAQGGPLQQQQQGALQQVQQQQPQPPPPPNPTLNQPHSSPQIPQMPNNLGGGPQNGMLNLQNFAHFQPNNPVPPGQPGQHAQISPAAFTGFPPGQIPFQPYQGNATPPQFPQQQQHQQQMPANFTFQSNGNGMPVQQQQQQQQPQPGGNNNFNMPPFNLSNLPPIQGLSDTQIQEMLLQLQRQQHQQQGPS